MKKRNKVFRYRYNSRDQRKFRMWLKRAYIAIFLLLFVTCLLNSSKPATENSMIFISFSLAAVVTGYAIWRRFISANWRFRRRVNEMLDYFLEQNNLVSSHSGQDRKGQSITVIDYYPYIFYYRTPQKFVVAFALDGSAVSETFPDLGKRLGNLFSLNLETMREDRGKLIFEFPLGKDARLHIATADDYRSCCRDGDKIRITGRLTWNFRKIPHFLVTGGTGSGKTFFLTYLMGAFYSFGAEIKIIDPKHSDISEFGRFVGEENVASDPNGIARLLREADEAMNARYEDFKARSDNGFGKDYYDYGGYKPTVIFFDEMTAFMGSAESKVAKEVNGYLMDIIMKGRQAGYFMGISMQRPDAEYLKAAIRDNLGMRVALGRMSAEGYAMVFGNSGRDLQLKNYQKGDGFIYIDGQTEIPRQFSAPFLAGKPEDMFSEKEEVRSAV